jgi:hypothetical protein
MKYYRVKKESSILHTKRRMKANWIGPSSVEAGKAEGRVKTRKVLSRYWVTLRNERVLEISRDGTVWRTGFRRGYRHGVRQTE